LNSAGHERLFTDLRKLLADVGSQEDEERFTQLFDGYRLESGEKNGNAALESINALRQLERSLLDRALSRWR